MNLLKKYDKAVYLIDVLFSSPFFLKIPGGEWLLWLTIKMRTFSEIYVN